MENTCKALIKGREVDVKFHGLKISLVGQKGTNPQVGDEVVIRCPSGNSIYDSKFVIVKILEDGVIELGKNVRRK